MYRTYDSLKDNDDNANIKHWHMMRIKLHSLETLLATPVKLFF